MVGGETVLFDLELNCKTKKTEAKRVKLAPLDSNLKNERSTKLNGMQVYFSLIIYYFLSVTFFENLSRVKSNRATLKLLS